MSEDQNAIPRTTAELSKFRQLLSEAEANIPKLEAAVRLAWVPLNAERERAVCLKRLLEIENAE